MHEVLLIRFTNVWRTTLAFYVASTVEGRKEKDTKKKKKKPLKNVENKNLTNL